MFANPIENYTGPADVFYDSEFKQSLKLCKDPYHLIMTIPLKGYAIGVKRRAKASTNPWEVDVNFLSTSTKLIFADLIKKDHSLKLGSDTVNAILPLFQEKDRVLMPLLKHELFQYKKKKI